MLKRQLYKLEIYPLSYTAWDTTGVGPRADPIILYTQPRLV